MSTEAYAKFLDYLDTSKSPINGQIAGWPKTDIGNGVSYSLGVFMRSAGTGFNFWHLGNWLRDDQKASFGAFFAMLHQGIGVVVTLLAWCQPRDRKRTSGVDSSGAPIGEIIALCRRRSHAGTP